MENLEALGKLELHDFTTTPLKMNETWTSRSDNNLDTGRVCGTVYSNVNGTLYIEQSSEGLSWDVSESISVVGGIGKGFTVEKVAQHARVRYINGGIDQTVFRLYVYRRIRVI